LNASVSRYPWTLDDPAAIYAAKDPGGAQTPITGMRDILHGWVKAWSLSQAAGERGAR
jgi:hypothetical protein